jgi:hypothetical protein
VLGCLCVGLNGMATEKAMNPNRRRHTARYRRRPFREAEAQAKAQGAILVGLLLLNAWACRNPQPGDIWREISKDLLEKQSKEFLSAVARAVILGS